MLTNVSAHFKFSFPRVCTIKVYVEYTGTGINKRKKYIKKLNVKYLKQISRVYNILLT